MTKCFRIQGINCAGGSFDVYDANWESISTAPGGCGVIFVLNGVPRGDLGSNQSVTITLVDCSFCGNPPNCNNSEKYDCINGVCTLSTTYNTPGIYSSLENCQSNCAKNSCPDGYECVEIASTEKLRKCICG